MRRRQGAPVVDPAIRAMVPDVRMAGPALTVVAEDDHLPVLSALAQARAGDVLVIAGNGHRRAVLGELFATEARRRGVAGVVIDGFCRDVSGLRKVGLPVFARGTVPMSGSTVARTPIGAPVRCGGVEVSAETIVFADDDGMVIAPPAQILAALDTAEAIGRAERAMLAQMAEGTRRPDDLGRARRAARPRRRAGSSSGSEPMAPEGWSHAFARRAQARTSPELTAILAGSPPGVLAMTGGFPNPATFPAGVLDEIVARLVRDDPGVALQYTPCEGLPSVREYLADRQEQLQGRRPARAELMVTSGGMECIALMCQALVDPGDAIAVEAPTYLGALLAFAGIEADVHGIAMDEDGLRVDLLAERFEAGLRPKFVYVIPEYQNPTGRTLPLDRRHALVELCQRHGVLIFEDVAYRELGFDGSALPSLWSLAPDLVVQAGTFSKVFFPGIRLGWAAGPAEVIAEMAAAKQNTDQCAGGLGQRMVEEYGRAGHFERRLPLAQGSTPPAGGRSRARSSGICRRAARGPSRRAAS